MAYSGKFKVRNKQKYMGDSSNVVYRSLWEKSCFSWCDKTPAVKGWSSEELIIPYYYDVDKRYHRYFPDLLIRFEDKTLLIEIKPKKETIAPATPSRKTKRYITEALTYVKNVNKWDAAKEYAKDHGWEFEIWTEETLQTMGILPKSPKGLRPLTPIKRRKKSQ